MGEPEQRRGSGCVSRGVRDRERSAPSTRARARRAQMSAAATAPQSWPMSRTLLEAELVQQREDVARRAAACRSRSAGASVQPEAAQVGRDAAVGARRARAGPCATSTSAAASRAGARAAERPRRRRRRRGSAGRRPRRSGARRRELGDGRCSAQGSIFPGGTLTSRPMSGRDSASSFSRWSDSTLRPRTSRCVIGWKTNARQRVARVLAHRHVRAAVLRPPS